MTANKTIYEAEFAVGDTVYIVSYISTDIKTRSIEDIILYRGALHYVLLNPYTKRKDVYPLNKVYTFDKAKDVLVAYCENELKKAKDIVRPSNG